MISGGKRWVCRVIGVEAVERKNREIAVFRDELDGLLQELDELKRQNMEKELLFMQGKSNLMG